MSAPVISDGKPVPSSPTEWESIEEAKHRVLARHPGALVPEDFPEVRPGVLLSWKRSLLGGADPAGVEIPHDGDFNAQTRLAQVSRPIMERLSDQLSDLSSWGFLTDRAVRLLTSVVGDQHRNFDPARMDLRPGLCFSEEAIGTNGIGAAHETQTPFIISGTEHFRFNSGILTTTGVNIRDPFTKRYVGTLGVHCRREYSSAAILPLVVELGRSIEVQLLASRADAERRFFDEFLLMQRRTRSAVAGVTRELMLTNTPARDLLSSADEELLRRLAKEAMLAGRHRTLRRTLTGGHRVSIGVHPVEQPKGDYAAVFVLTAEQPRTATSDDRFPSDSGAGDLDHSELLRRALAASQAVLLTGERGAGKRWEAARALTGAAGEKYVEFDCAVDNLDSPNRMEALVAALADPGTPVLLSHIQDLPLHLIDAMSDLVSTARGPLVGTTSEQADEDGPTVFVRESFPVVVDLPPLRDRAHEFSRICQALLESMFGRERQTPTTNSKALSALMANDWPGNVRQLRQVLATSAVRSSGRDIRLEDLPSRYRRGFGSAHTEMERVERQSLIVALRASAGNRNAAAERLGISRATMYRKLKRYELH